MTEPRDAAAPGEAGTAASLIREGALYGALINGLINGLLNAWNLAGKGPHLLSADSIANREPSVLGSAVTLAACLAFNVSTIQFFLFRRKAKVLSLAPEPLLDRPYFFFGFRQALASALFVFAVAISVGVLWQRYVGTLTVSTPVAAAIAGGIAAVATYYTTTRICWAILRER
jgi:hypothetical protein